MKETPSGFEVARRMTMSPDQTPPEDPKAEALSDEDLKAVAGGLAGPEGDALGEAGGAVGEAI